MAGSCTFTAGEPGSPTVHRRAGDLAVAIAGLERHQRADGADHESLRLRPRRHGVQRAGIHPNACDRRGEKSQLVAQCGQRIDDDLIFVGWSAGGMYAREYYRQFPDRVKGMVLVDSAHEQTIQRMPPQPSNQENLDRLMRTYNLAQLGWVRLSGQTEEQYADSPSAGAGQEEAHRNLSQDPHLSNPRR